MTMHVAFTVWNLRLFVGLLISVKLLLVIGINWILMKLCNTKIQNENEMVKWQFLRLKNIDT